MLNCVWNFRERRLSSFDVLNFSRKIRLAVRNEELIIQAMPVIIKIEPILSNTGYDASFVKSYFSR